MTVSLSFASIHAVSDLNRDSGTVAELQALCLQETQEFPVRRDQNMPVVARTVFLLALSNVFMTFAWYAHLKNLANKPWYVAAFISWGIALFEYLLQVPANRVGYTALSLPQLKIIQEVVTLTVFVPFVLFYMRQPMKLDYLWAALCMLGAVYFVFRK